MKKAREHGLDLVEIAQMPGLLYARFLITVVQV